MKPKRDQPNTALESFADGRDEMNLVECPLSAVADRFLDGRKTVVFTDQVWDKDERAFVNRELAISGSDRYGLPTARDEDVLLACLQLTRLADFQSREVQFTRYELLKLLRWPIDNNYYKRLATSLRRWKGVTLYSDRAFYDHANKSWVNRDFGILDNLYLYERESRTGSSRGGQSRLVWNEVMFRSFQAGYVKRLDWDLYCKLTDPVAKRLYRLLDKRFYHDHEVVFDLHELAFRKIRLSENYNTAQIKRRLAKGLHELELRWELQKASASRRYVKQDSGRWQVVFERKSAKQTRREEAKVEAVQADLACELARRGIGPAMAADLVGQHSADIVREMIELFDWYLRTGKAREAGFLVDSIKNPGKYRSPKDFVSTAERTRRKSAADKQDLVQKRKRAASEQQRHEQENSRLEPFLDFWSGLDEVGRADFEIRALTAAEPLKRDGYRRLQEDGGPAFEQYRQVILRDFFEQQRVEG